MSTPRRPGTASAAGPCPGAGTPYPEQAAAGLWSTPTDLARFFVAIERSRDGETDALLPCELAEQMATPYAANVPYGMGLQLADDGEPASIGHSGSDEGFRAYAVLYATGQGAVVMTNADSGLALVNEVVLPNLIRHLAWPTKAATPAASMTADPAELAGTFRTDKGTVELRAVGSDLELRALGQPPLRLVRVADGRWRCTTLQLDVTFPSPETLVLHQHAEYVKDVVATRVG
jgi:CubicO group peptidase (beta-lactamase class C family)